LGIGSGVLDYDSAEKTQANYAKTVGQIEGLNEILHADYDIIKDYERIQEEDL